MSEEHFKIQVIGVFFFGMYVLLESKVNIFKVLEL